MTNVSFFSALAVSPFLLLTLFAGLIASVAGGIVGSYVVVKRIAFISGSIAHSVLSGMGLFLYLNRVWGISWASPLYGALIAAIISALCIGWVHLQYREREDSVIAAIWAIGMAIGLIFIALTPGYNVDLTSFLLGDILWISPTDLITLGALDLIVLVIAVCLHKQMLAMCFDEDQARLQGVPVKSLYMLLLILVAITVVLLVQVVGIVLIMTMLTIPAAVASLYSKRLSSMMVAAVILGMVFVLFGTWLSFDFNWPTGATIALLAGVVYFIALPFRRRSLRRF